MPVSRLKNTLSARLIRKSGLFDSGWYRTNYPDLADLKGDPVRHYIEHGAAEGRNPSALFDTAYYLSQYADLDPRKVNPLCHYILVGKQNGAFPTPAATQNAAPLTLHAAPQVDLGTLLGPREQRVCISEFGGLEACASQHGYLQCRVTNDDPYLVFSPKNGGTFSRGYYRLRLSLSQPEQTLLHAKVYFDYGDGLGERDAQAAEFHIEDSGKATALLQLTEPAHRIRLDPVDHMVGDSLHYDIFRIELKRISPLSYFSTLTGQISTSSPHTAKLVGRTALNMVKYGRAGAANRLRQEYSDRSAKPESLQRSRPVYLNWVNKFDTISTDDHDAMSKAIDEMVSTPKISIVMPVYNTPETFLRECIDSVLDQTYPYWELCIADDNSTAAHIRQVLSEYERKDDRIKVTYRTENGHISKATNSAIELATGDWIALLDHDDLLAPHALFMVAAAIAQNPDARMFYSDEDKIDIHGVRSDPYFKSDWNERLFFEQNMVCHLGVYDADLVREIGGFRAGFEGSQDHDLVLRFVEHIKPDQIIHIPHVLYHWRILPGSTALGAGEKSYALDAGIKALEKTLARRGIHGKIDATESRDYYRLKLSVPDPAPLVSIIIPTRDGLDVLEPCIRSVLETTTYPNYEILIVDNQSEKQETLEYFKTLESIPNVSVLLYDDEFNYSAINNFAVRKSSGSLICLLNNDTEVISPDWLSEMVAELSQPEVGAVGAKLLYTDGTVQHAGVILGVGGDKGVAGHGLLSLDGMAGGYFSYAVLARETSAVTAACLLTTRDVFEEVGGLNEKELRVAFNDIDFCLKIREAGYKIIWTPYAVLHHHESKSRGLEDTPEKQKRFTGEVHYMLDRWGELLQHDPYYNPNLSLNAETYSLADTPRVQKPWR